MIQTTGRPNSLATVGLKPEAGRAERGRGADSESESESEADEGGPREPARELQSKFREAPSGWLCRNDSGSGWKLDLRATGQALASESAGAGPGTEPG